MNNPNKNNPNAETASNSDLRLAYHTVKTLLGDVENIEKQIGEKTIVGVATWIDDDEDYHIGCPCIAISRAERIEDTDTVMQERLVLTETGEDIMVEYSPLKPYSGATWQREVDRVHKNPAYLARHSGPGYEMVQNHALYGIFATNEEMGKLLDERGLLVKLLEYAERANDFDAIAEISAAIQAYDNASIQERADKTEATLATVRSVEKAELPSGITSILDALRIKDDIYGEDTDRINNSDLTRMLSLIELL